MARPDLNPLEREFLEASRELHEREVREAHARVRRLRLLSTVASALFVVAAVVGGLAVVQWRNADQARQRSDEAVVEAMLSRLETEIPLLLKSDRSLAFALAAQAHKLQPGPRTDSLLNLVLGEDPRYLGRIFPSEPTLSGYAVSPDGKYIAMRSTTGLFELYDATTRARVTSIQAEPTGAFGPVIFLPDQKSIVSGSYDPARQHLTIVVRAVPGLAELRRFEFPAVRTLSYIVYFAPDGRLPIVINNVLHFLGLADGSDQAVTSLPPLVEFPVFDPLSRFIAAPLVTPPRTVALFDARTFALVRTLQLAGAPGTSVFTPDGKLLAASFGQGNEPGRAELWDPATGELLASTHAAQAPGLIALDSSGTHVAFPTANTQLGVFSLPGLNPIGLPFPLFSVALPVPKFGLGDKTIYHLALTYALEHWDLSGTGLASAYSAAAGPGEIGFAPDGSWFIKQSPDGHWSRWRLPSFTLIDRSTSSAGETTLNTGLVQIAPVVSADGKYFATGHSDCPRARQDPGCAGSVVIWEAATGRALGQPIPVPNPRPDGGPIGLAFHPDLPLLAIDGTDNLVIIVDLEGGTPRVRGSFITVNNDPTALVSQMAFLPSDVVPSPTIVTVAGQTLSVWAVGREVAIRLGVWETSASVRGFGVAPDGEVALMRATGDLQFVRYESLLRGTEPEPVSVIRGVVPPGTGMTPRFSADGRMMSVTAAANFDGGVAVWDLERKVSIGSSFASSAALSAFLTPDGKSLLVASDETTILWDLDTKLWAEKVCFAAGRNLTEAEWTKYFPGRDYKVSCERWPAKPKT